MNVGANAPFIKIRVAVKIFNLDNRLPFTLQLPNNSKNVMNLRSFTQPRFFLQILNKIIENLRDKQQS